MFALNAKIFHFVIFGRHVRRNTRRRSLIANMPLLSLNVWTSEGLKCYFIDLFYFSKQCVFLLFAGRVLEDIVCV